METIQSLLLGSVCCPSFTGVKECAQDAGSVHPHLGVHRQVVVGPHPFVELGHDCGGFRDVGVSRCQRSCRSCRKVSQCSTNRLRGSTPDFLSGFTPLAAMQWLTRVFVRSFPSPRLVASQG